jgi:cytochrome c peroxidase
MKKVCILSCLLLGAGLFWYGCNFEEPTVNPGGLDLPSTPYPYAATGEGVFGQIIGDDIIFEGRVEDFTPEDNPITDEGATLGRVLFYDPRLSLTNTVSCASCHRQEKAFADRDASSMGFGGKMTPRNAMGISNLRFQPAFFWDLRTRSLEEQVLEPVENHLEMGMETADVLEYKLAKLDYYPPLFKAAFGSSEVTAERISKAMAQFLRSMVAHSSRFDEGQENNYKGFNARETMGMNLFFGKAQCSNCHQPPLFTQNWGDPIANIGLEEDYEDEGIGEGHFRIPSLRNVALTGPYMHDGRFSTLREVIEHYNSGVKAHPQLDWRLKDAFWDRGFLVDNGPRQLELTEEEKDALEAFLHTLTDRHLTRHPMYSSPF